ncbi:hypothetical protein LCGC14_1463890 [marine sediment metagenome]|uniref:Leucine-binding protein domain-containing protein n=1 Tax=marine sediment metagenome TaxID=412755 RepID=A0A0F9MG46_9ZZZZ|nr:amino acid ABC transporter substrate-binding protein [Desulfobacterales bacterium]
MKNKISLPFLTIILITSYLLVVSAISAPAAAVERKPILVGMSWDITGWNAPSGRPEGDGAILAVEDWNERGGVFGGHKVEYLFRDDESDPIKAAGIAREFIRKRAIAVVGGASSTGAIATVGILAPAKIPFVHNAGSLKALQRGPDGKVYSFSSVGYTPQWPAVTFHHMQKNSYKRIALIYTKAAFGIAVAEEVRKAVVEKWGPKYGMEIVSDIGVEMKAVDLSSEVAKIKKSKPDAIWCGLYAGNQAAFAVGLRTTNWLPPPPFYVIDAWVHEVMAARGRKLMWGAVGWGGVDSRRKDVQELNARFKKRFGYESIGAMLLGYDAMNVILHAIDKVGTDPLKIRDIIEKEDFPSFRGRQGTLTYYNAENGYNALKPEDHVLFRVNEKGEEIIE